MSRLMRDGTAEPVSRDQVLRREHGQGNFHFPWSADHKQDWQPYYSVDPHSCYMCDYTYIMYVWPYIQQSRVSYMIDTTLDVIFLKNTLEPENPPFKYTCL